MRRSCSPRRGVDHGRMLQNVKESFERVATDWEEDLHKRGELLRRERVGLLYEYCLLAEKRAKVDENQGQQDQFAEENGA